MMKELKKQFYLRWNDLALILLLQTGLFLFGEIVLAVMVHGMNDRESIFPFGTLLALLVPFILMLFLGMYSLPVCFNMAIGMGTTRRRMLPAFIGISLLQYFLGAGMVYLCCLLEKWIFRIAYAGIENELDMQTVFQWKYIVPACIALAAWNTWMGAVYMKYEKKAFLFFWVLWMTIFIGGFRINRMLEKQYDHPFLRIYVKVAEWFREFPESAVLPAIVLISAVLIAVSYRILCRQQVQSCSGIR